MLAKDESNLQNFNAKTFEIIARNIAPGVIALIKVFFDTFAV